MDDAPFTPGLPMDVRPATSRDLGFIYKSWMSNLWRLPPWSGNDKNWFFAAQHALIEELLGRPTTLSLVACSTRNEDQIYGYLVGEPVERAPLLHWIYTKAATSGRGRERNHEGAGYRRAGVATRLVETAFPELGREPITCSIRTPACGGLPGAWRLTYNTHTLCKRAP